MKIFAVGDMRGLIHLYKFDANNLQTEMESDKFDGNIFAAWLILAYLKAEFSKILL